jgi:sporulation protein YpjB
MFLNKMKHPGLWLLALCLLVFAAAACENAQERAAEQRLQKSGQANPADLAKLDTLNRTADEMYKLTMNGEIMQARNKLLQMGAQVTQIHFDGVTSVEGVHALTETITGAKRVFNAAQYQIEEGRLAAAKLRLAADALTHRNEPMWLQYHKVLHDDLNRLEQSVKEGKGKDAAAAFADLNEHYSIVRPAIRISRQPSETEKLDSLFTFMKKQLAAEPMPAANVKTGIAHMRDTVDQIFAQKDATAYLPVIDHSQPILWSLVIGSIIALILSYSAWRMFQTGRGAVPVRREDED